VGLARWTKHELAALFSTETYSADAVNRSPDGRHYIVIISTVVWFLEKVALRGELTWRK
jgi:hypothetical protein